MNKHEQIKNVLEEILRFVNIRYNLTIQDMDDKLTSAEITGDNLSFLIGFRGETLDALQNIVNQILFKRSGEWNQVLLDINGYKKQKNEKIIEIAKSYIDRVRFSQKDVEMPPMNPSERRQVHTFVGTYDDIVSESSGEGINRRVILKLKNPPVKVDPNKLEYEDGN